MDPQPEPASEDAPGQAPAADDGPPGDAPQVDETSQGDAPQGSQADAPQPEPAQELQTTTEQPVEASVVDELGGPAAVGGGVVGVLLVLLLGWAVLGRRAPQIEERRPEPVEEVEAIEEAETIEEAEAIEEPPPAEVAPPEEVGIVEKMRLALGRTRSALVERFDALRQGEIDEAALDRLEEALLLADVGIETTERLLKPLRDSLRAGEEDPEVLRGLLLDEVRSLLAPLDAELDAQPDEGPWVILVVGVNGSGKTTTIGKLAARLRHDGRKVLLAAGDTYRAAASDQLKVWAERAEVDIVAHDPGADPGAVVYDALDKAAARGHDTVIVDTAGRLQTRKPLMEQLSKIRRVIGKKVDGGPHETLLVLDGTMGQNGLSQARLFDEATPLTGVVVTKLDGTAKGGMILTLAAELELPVKLVGIGEKIEDLEDFDANAFAEALA